MDREGTHTPANAMGVDGFWDLVTKKCGSAFDDLDEHMTRRGTRWIIDIAGFLYAYVNGKDEFGNYRLREGEAPIEDVLNLHARLRDGGIEPTYVFDGKTHPLKRHEHLRRKRKREKERENIEQFRDFLSQVERAEEAQAAPVSVAKMREIAAGCAPVERRLNRKVAEIDLGVGLEMKVEVDKAKMMEQVKRKVEETVRSVSDECTREIMEMMERHNIPFYISMGDAERLGAQLTRLGRFDVLVTDDGDGVVFGATLVLRNLKNSIGSKLGPAFVDPEKIRGILGLTKPQLVDVCLMSGTDFTGVDKKEGGPRGIPSIGMARAIAIIKKHGSLDDYFQSNEWKLKLAQIKTSKNEKARLFDMDKFHYKDAHAYFLGDAPEFTYESKAINPKAGPIPGVIRPPPTPLSPSPTTSTVGAVAPLSLKSAQGDPTPPPAAPGVHSSTRFLFPPTERTMVAPPPPSDSLSQVVMIAGREYSKQRPQPSPSGASSAARPKAPPQQPPSQPPPPPHHPPLAKRPRPAAELPSTAARAGE